MKNYILIGNSEHIGIGMFADDLRRAGFRVRECAALPDVLMQEIEAERPDAVILHLYNQPPMNHAAFAASLPDQIPVLLLRNELSFIDDYPREYRGIIPVPLDALIDVPHFAEFLRRVIEKNKGQCAEF